MTRGSYQQDGKAATFFLSSQDHAAKDEFRRMGRGDTAKSNAGQPRVITSSAAQRLVLLWSRGATFCQWTGSAHGTALLAVRVRKKRWSDGVSMNPPRIGERLLKLRPADAELLALVTLPQKRQLGYGRCSVRHVFLHLE